jgi:hypothetical protein
MREGVIIHLENFFIWVFSGVDCGHGGSIGNTPASIDLEREIQGEQKDG